MADGVLPQRRRRRAARHPRVEEHAEDRHRLGRPLVRYEVEEVAHRAAVQLLERVRRSHVGVVQLAQQRLDALVHAAQVGGDLQQDPLLFGDHHVDCGASQIHLERGATHARVEDRSSGIDGRARCEDRHLLRVVLLQP